MLGRLLEDRQTSGTFFSGPPAHDGALVQYLVTRRCNSSCAACLSLLRKIARRSFASSFRIGGFGR